MSVSVCGCVHKHISKTTVYFCGCCLWLWLGPPQWQCNTYDMWFGFYGLSRVPVMGPMAASLYRGSLPAMCARLTPLLLVYWLQTTPGAKTRRVLHARVAGSKFAMQHCLVARSTAILLMIETVSVCTGGAV